MKQLKPDHNNKWFLTSALLAALALNTGLNVFQSRTIENRDFASSSPYSFVEESDSKSTSLDGKSKIRFGEVVTKKSSNDDEKALQALHEKVKELTGQKTPATPAKKADDKLALTVDSIEADIKRLEADEPEAAKKLSAQMEELKKKMKEKNETAATVDSSKKERALKKLGEIQTELAKDNVSAERRKELVIQLQSAAKEVVETEAGSACDAQCQERKASKSALDTLTELVASLSKKVDKKEESTDEDKEKKRAEEAIAKIDKMCKKEKESRRLKCYTDEFLALLERNTGDKKLDQAIVRKFYEDKIEEEMKENLGDADATSFRTATAAVKKLERSLPSDYNFLRREVVDAARTSLKESALEVQNLYRQAKMYEKTNPQLWTAFMQEAWNKNRILEMQHQALNIDLRDSLSEARSRKKISSSLFDDLYVNRWQREMYPVLTGLRTDPYRLVINDRDRDFMEMARSFNESFNETSRSNRLFGQADAAQSLSRQGRNSQSNFNIGGSTQNDIRSRSAFEGSDKMTFGNENVNFGSLGSRSNKPARGAYPRQ